MDAAGRFWREISYGRTSFDFSLCNPLWIELPRPIGDYIWNPQDLLWARGDPAGVPRPHLLLDRAIKAFGLVLEAGGFGVVALDLGDAAPVDLARLPFTTWRRLHRFVEGRDTIALVLAPAPMARSARGVTLELSASTSTATWVGESRRARRLIGLSLAAQVRTARRM